MPKLIHPVTGRPVSVSVKGVEALKARGYTDPLDRLVELSGQAVEAAEKSLTPEAAGFQGVKPAQSDTKAAWVAYAESQGVHATGLTKAELIERVG